MSSAKWTPISLYLSVLKRLVLVYMKLKPGQSDTSQYLVGLLKEVCRRSWDLRAARFIITVTSPASPLFVQPFYWRKSKKASKLCVTGLCAGKSPVTSEFPAQMASSAEMFPFDDVITYLELPDRFEMCQSSWQQFCRCVCHILMRSDNLNCQTPAFTASQIHTLRCL